MNVKTEVRRIAKVAQEKARGYLNSLAEQVDDLVTTEAEKRADEARADQAAVLQQLERDNTMMRKQLAAAHADVERLRGTARDAKIDLQSLRGAYSTAVAAAWVLGLWAVAATIYIVVT